MATIVLQAAGAFLGGFFGPVGTALGTAAGALAGYYVDRALIEGTRRIEGPRLSAQRPFTAEEGAPIPRLYGAARTGGTLIWATRFEEASQTRRQGGKGGPKVTTYSYFGNAAFALCEGPIAGIRRVWADGREVDREFFEMRVHAGGEDQPADPLIEAKQGAGNAPAYRGTAYVVIERFPLEEYGNRIPQFQFEVLRPVGDFRGRVRAVALIPGSTEYGLSTARVNRSLRPGETALENRHVLHAGTDLAASLDELQMLCPKLEHVALVATWFGDDLRAGHCRIRPKVTTSDDAGFSQEWTVSGVTRAEAAEVSSHAGAPAYGGILADHGLPAADAAGADGMVAGYVAGEPGTARAALEPLAALFGLGASEEEGRLRFFSEGAGTGSAVEVAELAFDGRSPVVERTRIPDHDLPAEASLAFQDPMTEYQQAAARQVRAGAAGARLETIAFPGMLEPGEAEAHLAGWMRRVRAGRESLAFAVAATERALSPGTVIKLPDAAADDDYVVESIEEGLTRRIAARRILRLPPFPDRARLPGPKPVTAAVAGKPLALFLDLPMTPGAGAPQDQLRVALWAKPWRSQVLFASPEETGFVQRAVVSRRAVVGALAAAMPPSAIEGRVQDGAALLVRLNDGELASTSRLQMLNGGNAAAVRSASGAWEILQFETAEEVEPDLWRLSGLLRGQLGTGDAMAAGAAEGAAFVLLDEAVTPAGLSGAEIGIALNWRAGPAGYDFGGEYFDRQNVTGGVRALTPLAPVHLRAQTVEGGDIAVSWVRRGRIDADGWLGTDIPLGEETETYRVEVRATDGALRRSATVTAPSWTYPAASIATDFPEPGAEADIAVRQVSAAVGLGLPAVRRIALA